MRLKKLFLLTTLLLLSLVTVLLVRASLREYQEYRAAKGGLQIMQLTRLAMVAGEKISLESASANVLLGNNRSAVASLRQTLHTSRAATDEAFAAVSAALEAQDLPRAQMSSGAALATAIPIAAAAVKRAHERLLSAREEIDLAAKLQPEERKRPIVATAGNGMTAVADIILEAVAVLSGHAGRIYPDLVDALVASQMAAELHEHAGRLGAQLTPPLMRQTPMDTNEIRGVQVALGRIEQLLNLIWLHMFVGNMDAEQSAELAQLRLRFMEVGLPLVKTLSDAGAAGKPYGMDVEGFSTLYSPELTPIVNLRDALFRMASEGGRVSYEKTFRRMLWQIATGVAVILLELAVFLFIRRRVLRPLIGANNALVDISHGKLDTEVPPTRRKDEIGDMLNAIASLKATSLEKRELEHKHERMIDDLRETSSVDYLTGLINRRAFSERAAAQLSNAVRHEWQVTVIALDIDHFKSINDRYGHAHGDAVLVEIARQIKRTIRVPDIAARFGGEEFIVYAGECDSEAGFALAERIRTAVANAIFFDEDQPYSVTLSAGVVSLPAAKISDFAPVIQQADDALYAAKNQGRNRTVIAPARAPQAANPPSPRNP
jgi:diguanylate cyclase (GGDEF)-like protein